MAIKTPTQKQTWAGVAILALPIISAVLGVKYEQNNPTPTANTTTNVAITALPAGATRSDQDIQALCKAVSDAGLDFHVSKSGMH